MTLYGTVLFVHVVAAIGLVGTTVLAHVTIGRARRVRLGDELRPLLSLAHLSGRAGNPLGMTVLGAGLYLTFAGDWWGAGWPVVSLVLIALAGAGAGAVVDPWIRRLHEQADVLDVGAPVPPEIAAELASPKGAMALWLISGFDAGIVALMTNKPGYTGSLVVALAAIAVAAMLGARGARPRETATATAGRAGI